MVRRVGCPWLDGAERAGRQPGPSQVPFSLALQPSHAIGHRGAWSSGGGDPGRGGGHFLVEGEQVLPLGGGGRPAPGWKIRGAAPLVRSRWDTEIARGIGGCRGMGPGGKVYTKPVKMEVTGLGGSVGRGCAARLLRFHKWIGLGRVDCRGFQMFGSCPVRPNGVSGRGRGGIMEGGGGGAGRGRRGCG